jgi:hypothetical protein
MKRYLCRPPCRPDHGGGNLEVALRGAWYHADIKERNYAKEQKIMLPDDPDISETYKREIIPGGCRRTDPATGECEDFSCIMCQGGQPGACKDYPKAQELLENARVMQQEVGFYLERLEKISKEEYDGQLSIIYSHDRWEVTLGKAGGKNLKAAALTLHEAVNNLIREHKKGCESKMKQVLYQKMAAMNESAKLNKPLSELQPKVSKTKRASEHRKSWHRP